MSVPFKRKLRLGMPHSAQREEYSAVGHCLTEIPQYFVGWTATEGGLFKAQCDGNLNCRRTI